MNAAKLRLSGLITDLRLLIYKIKHLPAKIEAAVNDLEISEPSPDTPQLKGETADKYNELLLAVENKIPDESRHETALRYIKEAQKGSEGAQAHFDNLS